MLITSPPRSPSTSSSSLLFESPSSTSLLSPFIPTQEQKRAYLWPNAELVATNNIFAFPVHRIDPRTLYPVQRVTVVCDNVEFVRCWDLTLSGLVLQYLIGIPNSWSLDILRLGFAEAGCAKLPIVLHLFVGLEPEDPLLAVQLALQIIQDVTDMISMNWQGERIYIDVCRPHFRSIFDTLALLSLSIKGLSNTPAGYYTRSPPFPGSSIGQRDPTGQTGHSGTLSGYVKHEDDFYALTAHHVLPYGCGTLAESPSPTDHKSVKETLQQDIGNLAPGSIVKKVVDFVPSLFSKSSTPLNFWLKIWNDSKNWDPELGTVTYHSTGKELHGFDWCLTKIEGLKKGRNYNRHIPYNYYDPSSGFQHGAVQGFPPADITLAKAYFAPGPAFKPVRTTFLAGGEICLKTPSRTMREWTIGSVNTIRTYTQSRPHGVPFTLYCIVSTTTGMTFSREGDSGAIILDKDFQPVAMVQSGEEAWNGYPDITHAMDLASVLTNVEEVNNWDKGSAVFCSGGD
ncbi:hypothetical protein DL95DRAFT_467235 [Leptodontidium sp. 2 PMI_412]|nr:hypothetical protein DL95DRAFT_467235 [Leptodontidium sp. 2 PMI_412]